VLLPEPIVPVPVLLPEPIVPVPVLLPEPVVPVSVPLEPVPGRLLVPEPLMPELPLPEPLLPDPELCASTNGAATTSTARAATTILLNLLNISLFSLQPGRLSVFSCSLRAVFPCAPLSVGTVPGGQVQFLCQRHAQGSAPSAGPAWGAALSYFESRRRQHSCKHRASTFSQTENTPYEHKSVNISG
jgi:hypothetical protein